VKRALAGVAALAVTLALAGCGNTQLEVGGANTPDYFEPVQVNTLDGRVINCIVYLTNAISCDWD